MRSFTEQPKTSQPATSAKSTLPARTHSRQSRDAASILHLQRTIGNRAVQRQLHRERTGKGPSLESDGTRPHRDPAEFLQSPPKITIPEHVRAPSTPEGMPDRIPPRVDTPVVINIAGLSPYSPAVKVLVIGDGPGTSNGAVTIDGADSVLLRASATVQLRGMIQTKPGSAGNLKLLVIQEEAGFMYSSGFSVSSVPQNVSTGLSGKDPVPGYMGIVALNTWESDSRDIADLDEVEIKEEIYVKEATGSYKGASQYTSGWMAAASGYMDDHHTDAVKNLTKPIPQASSKAVHQGFIFNCARTGAAEIPVMNSGFLITRSIVFENWEWLYENRKIGKTVIVKGTTVGAGRGFVFHTTPLP